MTMMASAAATTPNGSTSTRLTRLLLPRIVHSRVSAPIQCCARFSSSERTTVPRIPKPTWSVSDLDLTSRQTPISLEELRQLARKSLLDVDHLKAEDLQSMRQDLGNMLHMVEQVHSYQQQQQSQDDNWTDAEIYDHVRGVTKAPVRRKQTKATAESKNDDDGANNNKTLDEQQAEQVWKSMLQPKTKQVGGTHEYFSIVTKNEKA